jgi:hypothetical protein
VELAEEMGMLHISWRAQLGAARMLRECGKTSDAGALQASARKTLDSLATMFKEDAYREAFEQSVAGKVA